LHAYFIYKLYGKCRTSNREKKIRFIIFAGFLLALSTSLVSAQQIYSDLSSQPTGRIYFNSVTPKTKWDLVHRKYDKTPTVIWGTLSMPKNVAGQVPAMVISHGSAGVQEKDYRWVQVFNSMGIAAFVVDSFGPRGIVNTSEDQRQLSPAVNDADALVALKLLSTDPRIDPMKIGQIGFSRGGSVALEMIMESFRKGIIDDDLKFAAAIGFYPGCAQSWWEVPAPALTGAPLMLALGEKDDYTPAKLCVNFAEIMKRDGQSVETHIYPGAYHDFDNTTRYFTYHNRATTASRCPQVLFDVNHGNYYHLLTGEQYLSLKEVEAENNGCIIRGVSTGSNFEQGNKAVADVKVFLTKALGL
jgi:dienelactone hydrolase